MISLSQYFEDKKLPLDFKIPGYSLFIRDNRHRQFRQSDSFVGLASRTLRRTGLYSVDEAITRILEMINRTELKYEIEGDEQRARIMREHLEMTLDIERRRLRPQGISANGALQNLIDTIPSSIRGLF